MSLSESTKEAIRRRIRERTTEARVLEAQLKGEEQVVDHTSRLLLGVNGDIEAMKKDLEDDENDFL